MIRTQLLVNAVLLTLATGAAFVMTSCGSKTDSNSPTENIEVTPANLRRGLGGEPGTLDPALADDNAALAVLGDLFEGLTAESADGTIIPGAAERWTIAGDGARWTFFLRRGLRWSDGRPLTAQHFARGIDAVRDPSGISPYAQLLDAIVDVRTTGVGVLQVTTSRPMPQLPAILALPLASPHLDAPASAGSVVSNGPYRLVSRTPGVSLQLERNPYFHAARNVGIARVRYLTFDDLATELNLYRAGEIDVTSEVPNAQIEWIHHNLPGELRVAPYLSTYGYAINLQRIRSLAARTGLTMAIDRSRITRLVTGAGEIPAYSWVPPGIAGYHPSRFEWSDAPATQRETLAAQHWARARQERAAPSTLKLCTDASANHRRTAIALTDQWRQTLGVTVSIIELEWKAYLALRQQPGDCDLLRFGWSADYVDPEAFLSLFATTHAQNIGSYANQAYDTLLGKAASEGDATTRFATLRAAEQRMLADAVVIPVFHRVTKRLVKPYVSGVTANPLGHLQSRYLRLDAT